jgi:hypothetical protein
VSYFQRPEQQYGRSYRNQPVASGPKLMPARFDSRCPKCGQGIFADETMILWTRGEKAVHAECPAPVVPAVPVQAEYASRSGFAVAPVAPVARLAIEDAGVYVLPDGSVVKVQANKEKTRTYAKRWTPSRQDRLMGDDHHEHGEYVYEAGLVEVVARTGRKMTLAEAKSWSIRIGKCIRCGRVLTDGKSVEQGMGPVCITYFS